MSKGYSGVDADESDSIHYQFQGTNLGVMQHQRLSMRHNFTLKYTICEQQKPPRTPIAGGVEQKSTSQLNFDWLFRKGRRLIRANFWGEGLRSV